MRPIWIGRFKILQANCVAGISDINYQRFTIRIMAELNIIGSDTGTENKNIRRIKCCCVGDIIYAITGIEDVDVITGTTRKTVITSAANESIVNIGAGKLIIAVSAGKVNPLLISWS